MATKELKTYSLAEMKDKYIGKVGTKERDEYEYELRMDVLGKMIKTARQERNLTQEELGRLVGVQKAQISKLESSANSATIDTILKVFKALKAEINFNVKIEDNFVKLAWQKRKTNAQQHLPNLTAEQAWNNGFLNGRDLGWFIPKAREFPAHLYMLETILCILLSKYNFSIPYNIMIFVRITT